MKKVMLLALAFIVVLSGVSYFAWNKVTQASKLPQKINDARKSNNLDLVKDFIKEGEGWYGSSFSSLINDSTRTALDEAMCDGYVAISRELEGIPFCKRTADEQSTLDKGVATWYGLLGKYTPQQVLAIASKVDLDQKGFVWTNIGHAYVLSGNMEKAMRAYSNFIKAYPKNDDYTRSSMRKDFAILSRLYPEHAKDFLGIDPNEIGFEIDEKMKAKYPELIKLLLASESMNKVEKQDWLDLMPWMSQSKIDRLFKVFDVERKKLEALEKKYKLEIEELNRKHRKKTSLKKVTKPVIHLGKYINMKCYRDYPGEEIYWAQAGEFKIRNNEYTLVLFKMKCSLDENGEYVPFRVLDGYDGTYEPSYANLSVEGEGFRIGDKDRLYYFSSDGKEFFTKLPTSDIKKLSIKFEAQKEKIPENKKREIEKLLRNEGRVIMVRVSEKNDTLNKIFREFADKNVGYTQADGTDTAWQQAKSSNSIESLRNFIRKNPASSHLGDAGKALYAQSLATHNLKDLKNFYEEFYDFPEVNKARVAYLDLLKKQTGLESRFTFREGKIGTMYVPSVTSSYGSTTTRYINGHAVNETTYHDSTSGGYSSNRYGFTSVYQIFNDSNQAYVVRVRASGSSTMSDMHTGTKTWSADEYNYSTTRKSKISQERSYLIKAKDSIKDQVVTGETKPVDFKLEIISAEPVSDEWMAKLQEALTLEKSQEPVPDGWFAAMKFKAKRYISEYTKPSVEEKLTLLSRYLADPKAEKWHKALQNRYSEIAEKNIVINIATDARFDRDFASNVDVSFENHTGHFVQVNFDPNFGRKGYVQLKADTSKRASLTAKDVSKDSLNVDVTSVSSMEKSGASSSVEEYNALQQQYLKGVIARAKAGKVAKAKAEKAKAAKAKAEKAKAEKAKAAKAKAEKAKAAKAKAEKAKADKVAKARAVKANAAIASIQTNMVTIPSGSFQMGSDDADDTERPVHKVKINSFKMGKYEVTQSQWAAVMGSNPSSFSGDNNPVESVSWNYIQIFIKKLNKKTGQKFRLPSEAEWEYAARSGTSTTWSWGNSDSSASSYAWYNSNSGDKTHPVGQKRPNAYGLYDMHGNVWEQVQDCVSYDYNGAINGYNGNPSNGKAWLSENCEKHRMRGGSFGDRPLYLRSASRSRFLTGAYYSRIGFRLAQGR